MIEHALPQAVQDDYVARLRTLAARYDRQLAALRTREDAMKRVRQARRKLKRLFGTFPNRTPLNVCMTGRLERRGYRIEKLVYESRPGLFVTANLYMPQGDGPFPAVLQPCGHKANGKADKTYQMLCHSLARQGYAVLIFDPISQGERSHQYRLDEGLDALLDCCHEHNMAGNQMTLVGDFFGTWRVWDGIRSLDVLLSMPGIDPTRVGVTGCSGGGTLSAYLNAVDERITMAAPACYVTTFLCNLENELPADAEQIPPGILGAGLDMADLFIARAPRPTILLGQADDYFDARGTRQTYQRIGKIYRLLGKADNIQLHIGKGDHGYHRDAREACSKFFNRHTGIPHSGREGSIEVERDENLFATPDGNVLHLAGARRTCDFTREAAAMMAERRISVSGRQLRDILGTALNLRVRKVPPHYRTLRAIGREQLERTPYAAISLFGLETEPRFAGQTAILQHWVPGGPDNRVFRDRAHPAPGRSIIVYVPHISSWQDMTGGHAPATDGQELYAIDVRGVGQVQGITSGQFDFFAPFGPDYLYASHGQLLGNSFLGRRTHDVLAALDLLQSRGARRVHLVGRGMGALLATFAAVLHPVVKQVSLHNALLSYHELTQCPIYAWPASAMIWNGLDLFDLPDCFRALRRKKLKITEPWDAQMRPFSPPGALVRQLNGLGLGWVTTGDPRPDRGGI